MSPAELPLNSGAAAQERSNVWDSLPGKAAPEPAAAACVVLRV